MHGNYTEYTFTVVLRTHVARKRILSFLATKAILLTIVEPLSFMKDFVLVPLVLTRTPTRKPKDLNNAVARANQ